MADDTCVLLTATIHVEHQEFLGRDGRVNTDLRLRDYVSALESWITKQDAIRDIVFVDNSGYPLDALRDVVDRNAAVGKRVELHSFRTTGYSPTRGRSFGELDIMRTALQQSALMQTATRFAKVTGRVFVPNFDAIMSRLATDFDVVGRLSHNLTWLETVFVLFRKDLFSERLLPFALEHVNDQSGHHIERVLASACLRTDELVCTSFPGAYCVVAPTAVAYLRRLYAELPRATSRGERLFVLRHAATRKLRNEDDLAALAAARGFVIIDSSTTPNLEDAFANADVIIGAHGAAMANLAFCRPGTCVLELLPSAQAYPFFFTLAFGGELQYDCIIGKSDVEHEPHHPLQPRNSVHDFTIDREDYINALDRIAPR